MCGGVGTAERGRYIKNYIGGVDGGRGVGGGVLVDPVTVIGGGAVGVSGDGGESSGGGRAGWGWGGGWGGVRGAGGRECGGGFLNGWVIGGGVGWGAFIYGYGDVLGRRCDRPYCSE